MTDKVKDEEGGDEGLKVTDKRRFAGDGEAKQTANEAPAEKVVGDKPEEKVVYEKPPEINFSTFLLSLATSAHVHLGNIPNPATQKTETDLGLAKQTIDILGVLEEKTRGNLNTEEARLMEHVLFDLRMIYVEKGRV